ncbi:DUF6660 family protein [Larkinella soli]|uniref:DUF6660 family protein n=1 Tax=Larkinella soli TaxID=1770527 RepID=UPI000FFC38CC|nr:DUF6660 family protein [Larkinella soli]
MKLWLLIWSMYLMALSGVPCPEQHCLDGHNHPAASASQPPADHQPDEAPCSPFCHCAVCPGFTVPQPLWSTLPAISFKPVFRPQFAYSSPTPDDIFRSVWQPPKI